MKFEKLEKELAQLYIKAKEYFKKSIQNPDNEFLKAEISIPLEEVVAVEKNAKIVFSQNNFTQYLCEVSLMLFEGSKEIGEYLYIENEKGEPIDDRLVFY